MNKKEKEICEHACSMAAYQLLQLLFGKEDYPEPVIEELGWFAENAMEDPQFTTTLGVELREGLYVDEADPEKSLEAVEDRLHCLYGYGESEKKHLVSILRTLDMDRNGEEK